MRALEERIQLLHERVRQLSRRREKTRLALSAVTSGCLACLLMAAMLSFHSGSTVGGGSLLTGASMLNTDVGGYVLTAVLAFMAGVFVTAGIRSLRHYREEHRNRRE